MNKQLYENNFLLLIWNRKRAGTRFQLRAPVPSLVSRGFVRETGAGFCGFSASGKATIARFPEEQTPNSRVALAQINSSRAYSLQIAAQRELFFLICLRKTVFTI
jgi:hypothetical protein